MAELCDDVLVVVLNPLRLHPLSRVVDVLLSTIMIRRLCKEHAARWKWIVEVNNFDPQRRADALLDLLRRRINDNTRTRVLDQVEHAFLFTILYSPCFVPACESQTPQTEWGLNWSPNSIQAGVGARILTTLPSIVEKIDVDHRWKFVRVLGALLRACSTMRNAMRSSADGIVTSRWAWVCGAPTVVPWTEFLDGLMPPAPSP